MDTNLRPTGIAELGDMSWGTHFCLFYETKEDLLDFFIPLFDPADFVSPPVDWQPPYPYRWEDMLIARQTTNGSQN